LEFNRRLSEEDIKLEERKDNSNSTEVQKKRGSIDNIPSNSYLSKKIFIYTNTDNRSEILSNFRSGKFAPKRPLNAIKVMHELVTVGRTLSTSPKTNLQNDKKNDNDDFKKASKKDDKKEKKNNFYAEIEWPGGRKTRTEKISIRRDNTAPFSILNIIFDDSRDRKELGVQYNLVNFMRGKPKKPFNRWVSLASPPDSVASGRSQEYYSISKEKKKFSIDLFFSGLSNEFLGQANQLENFARKVVGKIEGLQGSRITSTIDTVDNGNNSRSKIINGNSNKLKKVKSIEGNEEEEEEERERKNLFKKPIPLNYPGIAVIKYKR
jgi:hypothetical protein